MPQHFLRRHHQPLRSMSRHTSPLLLLLLVHESHARLSCTLMVHALLSIRNPRSTESWTALVSLWSRFLPHSYAHSNTYLTIYLVTLFTYLRFLETLVPHSRSTWPQCTAFHFASTFRLAYIFDLAHPTIIRLFLLSFSLRRLYVPVPFFLSSIFLKTSHYLFFDLFQRTILFCFLQNVFVISNKHLQSLISHLAIQLSTS